MKLVIDIPEEFYTACKKWVVDKCASIEQTIIADGIPVSTNGDLISREDLRKAFHERIWYFDKSSWDEANALIDSATTVDIGYMPYREETCENKSHCYDYEHWHCIGCNGCKKGGVE